MTKKMLFSLTALLLLSGGATPVAAFDDGPFAELLASYNDLRSELVQDDLTDAIDRAELVREHAESALDDPVAENAQWVELVEEIAAAATKVGSANDLEAAREAFFELTKPLSRYRRLVGDESTVVAYCPMEKKAWLQPDGEIENPYGGQAMPRCGQTIPD